MAEVHLTIPDELQSKLQAMIEGSSFGSVDEYILYVLGELVTEQAPPSTLSQGEQRAVEERLRGLGYIE